LLFTLLVVAISLSMDAFSLALIYGTLNIRKSIIYEMSIIVGVFHFFMPLFGYLFGNGISNYISFDSDFFIGVIFIFLAIEMFISVFKDEEVNMIEGIMSLLLFAFTVSIDSFSVGIGLGLAGSNSIMSFLIFAFVSFLFTFLGLRFGSMLSDRFGKISTIFGSTLLVLLGFCHLF